MSKTTITIDDTLDERVDSAIEDVRNLLFEYLDSNTPDSAPDYNDLDYSGSIHEIIDGSVPIYTKEIEDAWYLHGREIETAYENAGVGDNPRENDGMAGIYFYIAEKVYEWYDNNAEDLFEEWQEKHRAEKLKNVEIFEVTADDFLSAESGTWQADRLQVTALTELPAIDQAAQALAGFYWWTCSPGCLPDSEAFGPFETAEEAEEDVINN